MRISWPMIPCSLDTLSSVKYGTETNESKMRRLSLKMFRSSKIIAGDRVAGKSVRLSPSWDNSCSALPSFVSNILCSR